MRGLPLAAGLRPVDFRPHDHFGEHDAIRRWLRDARSGSQQGSLCALAETAAVIFKDHGALGVVECWGDDVPEGKLTSFPMAVQRKPDEAVVFSWVTWPSKAARDTGLAAVMEDPRMAEYMNQMPFDSKRMIFGGFAVLVNA